MDLWSIEFFSALGAIILIDLVLAGDNALVIALAARNLPKAQQRKAIFWGTVGAIVVRSVMTVGVVWLLKVPGVMLAGGLILVWIAVKLMTQDDSHEHAQDQSVGFWAAMRTIVIADAVMGVDNVLGVAGASHGSFLLVGLGLVISIPIVVWCSGLVLKLIERHPAVIDLGAVVLAWTAASMIVDEPLIETWIQPLNDWSKFIEVGFAALVWLFARCLRSLRRG
ncbi:YjbE family integral membrane protein [Jezberella montanilacus]|jgi:YjbE family integral membrane protein|uniref:YjbE family integral membrane protein n=1 Tax=Jezberella montanilacus TaxID=323426 RepID=A0A2T0XDU2_9BURK|nr:TerC family protein [Jezberella montanilacus]PRY97103.1 YjbE family integral membrane protein [Jezberella montanilacus]